MENNGLFKKDGKINVVFDLHNVLDLLDDTYKIERDENTSIIVCSYVGRTSKLVITAREQIKKRVASGQVDWGVLVFCRGKKNKKDTDTFHKPGSKAWFCDLVNADYFFDDADDHIKSVKSFFLQKNKIIIVKHMKKTGSNKKIKITSKKRSLSFLSY